MVVMVVMGTPVDEEGDMVAVLKKEKLDGKKFATSITLIGLHFLERFPLLSADSVPNHWKHLILLRKVN